ncbi:hypothetical protein EYF80_010162 [Liparis tanakae]|uniref:Uncharacterized protein n=1 Tax=Liparis tanakae TaxID=230148 RepID=A0A4Z2INE9_9TELE|nr:hypothetical protein EYF80_010162 [Liparis tanakae]
MAGREAGDEIISLETDSQQPSVAPPGLRWRPAEHEGGALQKYTPSYWTSSHFSNIVTHELPLASCNTEDQEHRLDFQGRLMPSWCLRQAAPLPACQSVRLSDPYPHQPATADRQRKRVSDGTSCSALNPWRHGT